MTHSTVELPAEPEIKQLAHDIKREGDEWTVDFLLDFHEFLAGFDSDNHKKVSDLNTQGSRTSYDFAEVMDFLEMNDYIKKHKGGKNTTYTLILEESDEDVRDE